MKRPIKLDNFKLVGGKIVADIKKSLASLPPNKRIAAQRGKTTGIKVVRRVKT